MWPVKLSGQNKASGVGCKISRTNPHAALALVSILIMHRPWAGSSWTGDSWVILSVVSRWSCSSAVSSTFTSCFLGELHARCLTIVPSCVSISIFGSSASCHLDRLCVSPTGRGQQCSSSLDLLSRCSSCSSLSKILLIWVHLTYRYLPFFHSSSVLDLFLRWLLFYLRLCWFFLTCIFQVLSTSTFHNRILCVPLFSCVKDRV